MQGRITSGRNLRVSIPTPRDCNNAQGHARFLIHPLCHARVVHALTDKLILKAVRTVASIAESATRAQSTNDRRQMKRRVRVACKLILHLTSRMTDAAAADSACSSVLLRGARVDNTRPFVFDDLN